MFKQIKYVILFSPLLFTLTAHAAEKADNLALISAFADQVFVNKDLSQLEKFMKENYIQHNPAVDQGIAGFKAFFSEWFSASPDFSYTLKNIIANEEFVWVYGSYSGTHANDWLGLPASHRAYQFDAVDIFRIEEGKLAEHWDVIDLHTLFSQISPAK